MPQWAALVAVSVIAASLFIAIAGLGVGDDVRRIAHLCAGAAGFSAFFFLVFGIPHIGLCMSVLREAKGNRSMSATRPSMRPLFTPLHAEPTAQ